MFKNRIKKGKAVILVAAVVLVIALVTGIFLMLRYKNYHTRVNDIEFSDISISGIADGIYIGEYDVDVIYAKVEVTVEDGAILDIEILEHRNERGGSAESIIDKILEEQRLDVDTVASATNSSKVIRKAIENALVQSQ